MSGSRHHNRPGQSALHYRLGTQPSFLHRMLRRLSRQEIPAGEHQGQRPLAKLATREPADPAIALLDAWATAADVLTFYQERIAGEGYLRTAGERRSVLELARAVGYELATGVAASAWLAFDVDDPPGVATVPELTQVLSLPGQDGRPRTFETDRELVAHTAWNRLEPVARTEPEPTPDGQLLLTGIDSGLRPGDVLLVEDAGAESLVTVHTVTADPGRGVTRVTLDDDSASPERVWVFRRQASLFGYSAPDWESLPEDPPESTDGSSPVLLPGSKNRFIDPATSEPKWPDEWPGFELSATQIDLDAVYPGILAGSRIVLRDGNLESVQPFTVNEVRTAWCDAFTVRGKVTRIEPDPSLDPANFGRRDTVVLAESEELELASMTRTLPISGNTVDVVSTEPPPEVDQALIFADTEVTPGGGEAAAFAARALPQVVFIQDVETMAERLRLTLDPPLERAYDDPRTVVIYGNVTTATHGETVREVLGGGDASQSHQRFVLRVPPLTHVAAADGGVESTLEVRVDDVLWHPATSFFDLGADSRGYTVRVGDDDVPTLLFGDGVRGARLPSGQENVVATYRSGSGPEGNSPAGSLALLKTRPLGVRAVINPRPASGGVPPDDLERGRARAPLSVRTLDRLVSLRDYETFARAWPGIGKARATLLPAAEGRELRVTVAGLDGAEVTPTSGLGRSLEAAVKAAGDPAQPVAIESYDKRLFRLTATVRIEPDHLPETVLDRVREALVDAFSFDVRDFGQGVAASEVVAVIQGVTGVVAVDLDALYDTERSLHAFLDAGPTELLLLELEPGDLVHEVD